MWCRTVTLITIVAALAAAPSAAAEEPTPRTIEYRDDRLTLRVNNVPVGDILEELRRQSGAELRGRAPADVKVSVQFDAVPLNEALPRLLGDNFTLTYAEDGRLKTIELKGGPEAPVAPKAATGAPEDQLADRETPPKWLKVYHTFEQRDRVAIQGRLAEIFGANEANWDLLMNTAIGYEEPRVRADAMRAALAAFDANPELRDATVGALGDMSDAELAAFARHNCKHMAESFLKNVARQTKNPEWRARAAAVLRELRLQARRQAATAGS